MTPLPRLGRHANGVGQEFGWVIGWTIAGTLMPGLGLLMAGRRRLGWIVLTVGLSLIAAAATLLALRDPMQIASSLALSPARLLGLVAAVAAGAVGLIWVISQTYRSLSAPTLPTSGQRVAGLVLVAALGLTVATPAALVGQYALIQRDLVSSLFHGGKGDLDANNPWGAKPRVNLLLLGTDDGDDRTGIRTDTMILASINTRTGDAVLFSLPRNLEKVPFAPGSPGAQAYPDGYYCPGHQECMLNAIWRWAADLDGREYYPRDKYQNPGVSALEDAVEGITQLRPDYYLRINIAGFADVVNALDGITVNVRKRLPIGGNAEHPERTTGWIEIGENQHLDGYHALWYARSRWATGDYDRMQRQRCTLAAILQRAQPATLLSSFPKLAAAAKDNMSTDISQGDVEAWAELALKVKKSGSVRSLPFTPERVGGNTADPDYGLIQQQVQVALNPPQPPATSKPAKPTPTSPDAKPSPEATPDETTGAENVTDVC